MAEASTHANSLFVQGLAIYWM